LTVFEDLLQFHMGKTMLNLKRNHSTVKSCSRPIVFYRSHEIMWQNSLAT